MDLASTPVIKTDQSRSNPGAPTAALLKNVPSQQGRFITSLQQSSPAALSSVTPSGISQASVTKQAMNSVSRLTALPVHSSSSSSTYHVPRGAAAVANIAVPRTSLATPIRGSSANLQALGVVASNNSTMVRGTAPLHSSGPVGVVRPPPPHSGSATLHVAGVGGGGSGGASSTWLSNNSSSAGTQPSRGPLPPSAATPPTTATPHFTRASPIGVTRLAAPMTTARVVTDSLSRPVLLQSTTHKQINISNINQQAQMHINDKTFLKTTGGVSMGVRSQTTAVVTSGVPGGRGPPLGVGVVPGGPNAASAATNASLNRIGATTTLPHTAAAVVSLHPNTVLVQTPSVPLKQQSSHTPKFLAQSSHIQMQTLQSAVNSITSTSSMTSSVSKPMAFSTTSSMAAVTGAGVGAGLAARPPALHAIANAAAHAAAAAAASCPPAASKVLSAASDPPPPAPAASVFLQTTHKPSSSSVTVPNVVSYSSNMVVGSGGGPQPGGYVPPQFEGSTASHLQQQTLRAATTTPAAQPSSTTHAHTHTPITCRPASSIVTNSQPTVRYNPVMVVDHNRQASLHHFVNNPPSDAAPCNQPAEGSAPATALPQTPTKPNASPRPSILRKRESEGSPLKAQKNLTPLLTSLAVVAAAPPPSPPPARPESRGGNGGSGGSTTISATSSPGLVAGDRDESPPLLQSLAVVKQESSAVGIQPEPPPHLEMSPRKKPRKQQLTGNQMQEPKHEVEMEFISEEKLRKESKEGDLEEPSETVLLTTGRKGGAGAGGLKRPNISLLSSYRHTWKSRHHHFLRYTDVKPKEERRPTINEIAAQKMVQQKINGWKLFHLGTQMQCLSDLETEVLEKLTNMLKVLERKPGKELDKDINRVNELIKGNIQRCKVIKDQMQEAKTQVMKIFDHKGHVIEILSRCSSKRSVKKRDRM